MPSIAGMMGGGGMGTSAGAAFVTIGANVAPFLAGMGKATVAARAFKKSAMGILAVAAAVKVVTSAYVEFDRQLKNTSTLVDYSTKKMDGIGNSVRAMARQYQVGSAEAQEALYHIYSATIYGTSAMDVLTESAKGAAAGLASLGAVGDMLTTVINAYGMAASRTSEINDYLFTTIKYGKVTMAELAGNFGRLAGVAAPVGASISEMSAAIATLTRQGIRTDWAITSLRQTLMQFIKPVKNLDEAITDMGYSSGTAIIRQEGFAGALKLVTKWAKENNVEMSEMFTNVRAITAVLPLTTTAAAGYAMDLQRMANSSGAATEAFNKQTKSMSFQLEKLGSLVKDTAISIGKALIPTLKILMTVVTALAHILRVTFETLSKFGGDWVIAAAASIGILIASVKGLTLALAKLGLTSASVATGGWLAGITGQLMKMFYVIGKNSALFRGFLAGASKLGPSKFMIPKTVALAGMATAALGIGAAAFSVKQIMNIEVEPIIKMGEVQGADTAIKALRDSIGNVISGVMSGAVSGAVIGGMLGQPVAGAIIGGAAGAIGVAIKIIHEVRVVQAELDAPRIEELKARFFAEFDFPETMGPAWKEVKEFLSAFDNVPSGAASAIEDAIKEFYQLNTSLDFTGHTLRLKESASEFKKIFGELALLTAAGGEEWKESIIEAWKQAMFMEATGGLPMPTQSERMLMSESELSFWDDIQNMVVDTVEDEDWGKIVAWMSEQTNAAMSALMDGVSDAGIDETVMADITAGIISALGASRATPELLQKAQELMKEALDPIAETLTDEEVFAFLQSRLSQLLPEIDTAGFQAVVETVLAALDKSFEDYAEWWVKASGTEFVPEEPGTSFAFRDFILTMAGIDPVLQELNKEFYELWKGVRDADFGEKAAAFGKLEDMISAARAEVEAMIATEGGATTETDALTSALDSMDEAIGNLEDGVSAAALAISDFNDALVLIDASHLLAGFDTAVSDLEAAYLAETNPFVSDQILQTLLAIQPNNDAMLDRLEQMFTDSEGYDQATRDKAYTDWVKLGGIVYEAGRTLEQIATDELARLNEEKATADEIAAKQKEAADAAKQAAEDAAAAAQEAFIGVFKEPMLEGVRSGDWQSAAETIVGFARASRDIMDFAGNLSSANGEIIDEIEVLGLITGSLSDLESTVDSMIQMGVIAGEDTLALRVFKNSLEDLQDPIAGLAAKIREILRIDVPEMRGAEYRKLILAAYDIPDSRGFASGGTVPGVGRGDKIPAMLEPGEFVIPNWMMNLPGMKDIISRIYNKKFAAGGYVDPSDMGGIAGIAGIPDNSLLGSAPFGVNITMPSVPTQPPYSDNSFIPAIKSNTTSIVSAIKNATSTITNSISRYIDPSRTGGIERIAGIPDNSLLGKAPFGLDIDMPSVQTASTAQGETDAVISEVRDAFNEAAETSIDAAAMSDQAINSAVLLVDAFAETLVPSSAAVADLADTIDNLKEQIKSGTLTDEEKQEAGKELITVANDLYAAYKNDKAAIEEQIAMFNDMGVSTAGLEDELIMLEASFKSISPALVKFKKALDKYSSDIQKLVDIILPDFSNLSSGIMSLIDNILKLDRADMKDAGKSAALALANLDVAIHKFKGVGYIEKAFSQIGGMVNSYIGEPIKKVAAWLGGVISSASDSIGKGLNKIADFIMPVIDVRGMGSALGAAAKDAFAAAASFISAGGLAVVASIATIVALIVSTIVSWANEVEAVALETFNEIKSVAIDVFGKMADVAERLVSSFLNLIQNTENYNKVQAAASSIQKKTLNVILGFIAPVSAVFEAFLGEIDETTETMNSLNVPTGYKVDRAAWKAATPGEPGDSKSSGDSGGMPEWLKSIMEKFSNEISAIADKFKEFSDIMGAAWAVLAEGIIPAVIGSLSIFSDNLISLAGHITNDLLPVFIEHMPGVISGALDFLFGAVVGIATLFVDTLAGILPNLDLFMQAVGGIGSQLPALFASLASAITPVINTLLEGAFIPLANFVSETLLPDLESFFNSFGEWWSSDMDPFLQSEVFPILGEWMKAFYDWIGGTLLPFLEENFLPTFKAVWEAIQPIVEELGGALGSLFDTVSENMPTITEFLTTFLEELGKKWTGMVETLDAYVQTKSGDIMGALETIWTSESLSFWEKVKTSVGLGAIAVWDWVKEKFAPLGESLGKVWDALMGLWDIVKNVLGPPLAILAWLIDTSLNFAIDALVFLLDLLAVAIDVLLWPFKLMGVIVYNVYVAINNAIEYIKNIGKIGNRGNQLEYKPIPALASGGFVTATGAALVHKGEVVAPAGTSPLGNYGNEGMMIENVMVVNGEVLYRATKKVNRQEQLRRTGSSIGGRAWQGA